MKRYTETLRFSGHDTFFCKESWLFEGVQYVSNNNIAALKDEAAIADLGVGKNMLRSIQHWLKAFNLIDDEGVTEFAKLIFIEDLLDPYLEKESTLWLLQYMLCSTAYASIYKLIFSDFFRDKVSLEFTEGQIVRFLNQSLTANNQKENSDKTLGSDFKVFTQTYVSPNDNARRNYKTVEDDYNVPLLGLNLVSYTQRRNQSGEFVYTLNRNKNLPPIPIFIYCLLKEFKANTTISFEDIRMTVGSYLSLSNDALDTLLLSMSEVTNRVVYHSDAGIRQVQIQDVDESFEISLLKKHYGV